MTEIKRLLHKIKVKVLNIARNATIKREEESTERMGRNEE